MRVFILLLITALSLFTASVELAGNDEPEIRKKRIYVKKSKIPELVNTASYSDSVPVAGGMFSLAAGGGAIVRPETNKKTVIKKRKTEETVVDPVASTTVAAIFSSKATKRKAVSEEVVSNPFNKEELLSALDIISTAKNNFITKFELVGAHNIPVEDGSDLLVAAIDRNKEMLTKFLIGKGIKLVLSTPDTSDTLEKQGAAINAFLKAIDSKKTDFLPALIDFDPETSVKLIEISLNAAPGATDAVLGVLRAALTKSSIDSEAIQKFAECAAKSKLLDLVDVILKSNVLLRMISPRNIVALFSDHRKSSQPKFTELLLLIDNDRLITPPFSVNMLLQAAEDDDKDFIDAIEPHLGTFSWALAIKAIEICLRKRHYYFADILLRTNTYLTPNGAFFLCSLDRFLDSIAKYANNEALGRLLNTLYYDNTTLLISDVSLRKICVGASYAGNIEVIDHLIFNNYFNLSMRFRGKSILRMALESGNSNLAKYLIKYYGAFIIFDSNTPFTNPSETGGDSLIYVAVDEQVDMFKYLLKLGANPNVLVRYNDTHLINLIYWCIENGHTLIVRALLEAGCPCDVSIARQFNTNPEAIAQIENLITNYETRMP